MKAINIRIGDELWESCRTIAEEENVSFNRFAEQALQSAVRQERKRKLRTAFEQLGALGEDVEFAFRAQAEAVFEND